MWDLSFQDGDLVIDSYNDIGKAEGVDDAKQSIIHILRCVKSSDLFNIYFGTDWLNVKKTPFDPELVKDIVEGALMTYEKIKEVNRIEVGEPDDNRKIKISLGLELDEGLIDTEVIV